MKTELRVNKLSDLDKFIKNFYSRSSAERIRQAIAYSINKKKGQEKLNKIAFKNGLKYLIEWFRKQLYIKGYTPKILETLAQTHDYGWEQGLGLDVKCIKKGKFNLGRYLNHLLFLIGSKDRQIKSLETEVGSWKENLLDYENALTEIMYNEDIDEKIREKLQSKFYWLQEVEDEDED